MAYLAQSRCTSPFLLCGKRLVWLMAVVDGVVGGGAGFKSPRCTETQCKRTRRAVADSSEVLFLPTTLSTRNISEGSINLILGGGRTGMKGAYLCEETDPFRGKVSV